MSYIHNGVLIIEEGTKKLENSKYLENLEIEQVQLPESLEEIGDQCFMGCENLTRINFPKNLKRIGNGAFLMNSKLDKVILNENLEEIGEGAFSDCSKLSEIVIPPKIKEIKPMCFYATSLKKIELSDNIEYIGEDAFWGNESLKEASILNPNAKIENCFGGCFNLSTGYIACGYPELVEDIFHSILYTILGLSTFQKHSPFIQEAIKQQVNENENIVMERILKTNNTQALNTIVKENLLRNDIQVYLDKAFENKQNEIIALLLSKQNEEEDFTL